MRIKIHIVNENFFRVFANHIELKITSKQNPELRELWQPDPYYYS